MPHGANQEYTAADFIDSIMTASYRKMILILNDRPELINTTISPIGSALHIAINNAADGTPIKLLIERGIDLTLTDHSGRTALEFAQASDGGVFVPLIEECIAARPADEIHLIGNENEGYTSE